MNVKIDVLAEWSIIFECGNFYSTLSPGILVEVTSK